MRTVEMSVIPMEIQGRKGLVVRAIDPLHGYKLLTGVTRRQVEAKKSNYKVEAENLFLARCGQTRQYITFNWS